MPARSRALLIEVMLHDERWHGAGEWPPSPFRLFQALVAAAARGRKLADDDRMALEWLEVLPPPRIAAPRANNGREIISYVPNNDLDAVGGDPDKVEKIRAAKRTRPILLQDAPRFLYVWTFEAETGAHVPSQRILHMVRRLYQFGRGVDMAWARAAVLAPEEAEARLRAYPGAVHEPCHGGGGMLQVPVRGSLHSLQLRHAAFRDRLHVGRQGRKVQLQFRQPPKPVSARIGYRCPPRQLLFEIRQQEAPERFAVVLPTHVAELVIALRDAAAERLRQAGVNAAQVERYLVGRGADERDKRLRVQIIPLPSIGHEHAGGGIRRVLVLMPPDSPLNADDVAWAFEGLTWGEQVDGKTGEISGGKILVRSTDESMARHYGASPQSDVQQGACRWRTVTPAALPVVRGGRKGSARQQREAHAVKAVRTALRHAGVRNRPLRIHVQREPFDRNAERADFYQPDRFNPDQLWHVAIDFAEPLWGPLVLGNGRYLGLGVMAPGDDVQQQSVGQDIAVFALPGNGVPAALHDRLLATARGALMRIDADVHGDGKPCVLFSGHPAEASGPLRFGHHAHVFLAAPPGADGRIRRLYVIAPWLADHSKKAQELRARMGRHFREVAQRLRNLYGRELPRITLLPQPPEMDDALLGTAHVWISATPYLPTRRPKGRDRKDLKAFMAEDVRRELARRNLPPMQVEVLEIVKVSGGKAEANGTGAVLRLHQDEAVNGPLLLGRGAHHGLGCFSRVEHMATATAMCNS